MRSITDRIKTEAEAKLGNEIKELFQPIIERMSSGSVRGCGVYNVFMEDLMFNRQTLIQKLQELIFKQEIDGRIDQAIKDFMAKVEEAKDV